MKFQLDFNYKSAAQISSRQKFALFGSCFADNIGAKFISHHLHAIVNPLGIVFSPAPLAAELRAVIQNKEVRESDLVFQDEKWHSLDHHSSFSNADATQVCANINAARKKTSEWLKQCDWLIITFGSAFTWRYKNTGTFCANCHKIPGSEFIKELLTASEISQDWTALITELKTFNQKLKHIFTVSPVRYIRDGLSENNLSKSQLISAVHRLCDNDTAFYFPAYELVIDVLRDYRFFKQDMVHPTEQAIDFVWEKFEESMFDDQSREELKELAAYSSFLSHRSLGDKAVHARKSEELQKQLKSKYPHLDWC